MSQSLDRRAVSAAILVPCISVLPVMLLGATAVQLGRSLGVTVATLGTFAMTFFLTSAMASFVVARAIEVRLGVRSAMRVASVFAAVSMLGIAAVSSRWTILPFLALGGLANAVAQPAANLLIARLVPPGRQGFYFAMKQSAVIGASLLSGLSVPMLVLRFGWRAAFLAGVGLAVAGIIVVPGHIEGAVLVPRHRRGARLERRWSIGVLTVGAGLSVVAVSALPTFLVPAAVEAGISDGTAGVLLAAASLAGLVARLIAGRIADAVGGEPLIGVAAMLGGGAAGMALLTGAMPIFVIGAIVSFMFGWGWPGLFNFGIVRHHPATPGIATGITQTGVYIGGVIGPILFGNIAQAFGFSTAWLVAAALMAIGAIGIRIGARLAAPM